MASSSRPARARHLSSIVPTSLIPEKSGNHSECSSYFCSGPMALGRLSNRGKPSRLGSRLAVELAPRHSFYDWCNEILAEAEFDEVVEMLCQSYYSDGVG